MNTIEILESNYPISNGNYNAFQCKLPLDFFTFVPADDPVASFVEIMKGIDTSKYFNCSHGGNKGYDPNMMLQVTLFAFMNGEGELRKMEELCKYDIRYMWLSNEQTPSFMAFPRFISVVYGKSDTWISGKTFSKATDFISKLNEHFHLRYETKSKYSSNDIGFIVEQLMNMMVENNTEIVYGKGRNRSILQKYYDEFLDIYMRLD